MILNRKQPVAVTVNHLFGIRKDSKIGSVIMRTAFTFNKGMCRLSSEGRKRITTIQQYLIYRHFLRN